jgi:hypothetical protein
MLEEENNKLTVEEALRKLRAYNEERWASIEDLVATTRLSDKWVRESLYRLEQEGRLFIRIGSHGIRLYSLKMTEYETESDENLNAEEKLTPDTGKRQVIRIGARVQVEKQLPTPLPILKELSDRRVQIRKILLDTDTSELARVFEKLYKEREGNGPQSEQREGNPFAAVDLLATTGLIDGPPVKDRLAKDSIMIGTSASGQPCVLGLRFGRVSIPVKFALTTAAGYIQEMAKGEVKKESSYEILMPKHLTPEEVTEDYDREFPGMNKIIRESFHYQIDIQAIEYMLDRLIRRRQSRVDIESLEHAQKVHSGSDENPLLLLKSGSLTPQEQSPFDLIDPTKGAFLLSDMNDYLRLKEHLTIGGPKCWAFGVLQETEPRRAVIRDIIDELLSQKLPDWERGRMNVVDDNDVLGLLLDPGEYTPVLLKTPHKDILTKNVVERARRRLTAPLYTRYDNIRKQLKTYQFFMQSGYGKAVRFDYPVFDEASQNEGPNIRDIVVPILFSASSTESPVEPSRPRVIKYAEDLSAMWLNKMAKMAPMWLGGFRK